MVSTRELVDCFVKIIPEFEYQFGRPMKVVTKNILTNYQSKVLSVLQIVPYITMSELADRLVMPKPQLTLNIDVLERLGFIERTSDASDRRKVIIRMTQKGNEYMEEIKENMCAYYERYINRLAQQDRDDLYKNLSELFTTLEVLNQYAMETEKQLRNL